MIFDDQPQQRQLRMVSSAFNGMVTSRLLGSPDDGNSTSSADDAASQQQGTASEGNVQFDPAVFWSVNAFIFVLVCTTVVWCCRYGKRDWVAPGTQNGRQSSDETHRQAVLRRQELQRQAKIDTPAQRTRKLLRSFQRHTVQMTVAPEDLVEEATEATLALKNDSTEDDVDVERGSIEDSGQLRLGNGSLVPNCCAICLMSYEVGEIVIWSSNKECIHAFHQECVVGWLVKMQPETPCPCCRAEFTDLERVRKEAKVVWGTRNAFNPNALSL